MDADLLPPTLEAVPGAPTPVRSTQLESAEITCGAGAPGKVFAIRPRVLVDSCDAIVAPIGREQRQDAQGPRVAAAKRCFSCGEAGHLARQCPLARSRAQGPDRGPGGAGLPAALTGGSLAVKCTLDLQ